jgi:outer membrane protein
VLVLAVDVRAQRELSLEEALALASGTSEQLDVARAGVKRAEANVRRTESQHLPQIGASAGYQRSLANQFQGITDGGTQPEVPPGCEGPFNPDPSLPLEERVRLLEERLGCPASSPFGGLDFSQLGFGAPNTWSGGLSFNWPIFTGGRVPALVRATEAVRDAARTNVTATDAQVRLEVTQAYFDAQLAAELVRISEGSLEQSEETLRLTEIREREGAQAEFDVLQARVARDNQRPLLIRRRSQHELALERLRTLIDLAPDEPLVLTTPVSEAANREVSTQIDITRRIPVQQASERVTAARHQVTAARAQRMPTITATSQYGLVAYSENFLPDLGAFRDNWTVGAAVQIPIYTGGRIAADIEAARADLAEAEAQLKQTVEAARLDTRGALAELVAARATWEATSGTVEQAVRGYDIARLRYREGVSIQLEVENARLLLEQARVNRALAARDLWVAQTRVELLPVLPLGVGAAGNMATVNAASANANANGTASTFSTSTTGAGSTFPQQQGGFPPQ